MIKSILTFLSIVSLFLFSSCSTQPKNQLTVVASAVPHAEILEFIKPELKAEGIDLNIIVTDDFNMPNRALANREIDANYFQHLPFLEEQIQQFHYPIESIAAIEIEPMGVYSKKIHKLSDLKDKATIAIPNDPTNEVRALLLLQSQGLIQLDSSTSLHATILNIKENPKQLKFIEVDAAILPRTLEDVDVAVINTNYALQANLSPLKESLALEDKNSPYANLLVIRIGDENRPEIQALKKALTSDAVRKFILNKYQGSVLPSFSS